MKKLILLIVLVLTTSCVPHNVRTRMCCMMNDNKLCNRTYSNLISNGYSKEDAMNKCCDSGICHKG